MTKVLALASTPLCDSVLDALRSLIVCGCALALIVAGAV